MDRPFKVDLPSGLTPIGLGETWPPWPADLSCEGWPALRRSIASRLREVLGEFPNPVPPQPGRGEVTDCGGYRRVHLEYDVEQDDRAAAWLLIPKGAAGPLPAVVALHPSTRGTGKDRLIGLAGRTPGSAPDANASYALDLVAQGFVVLAPDVWGDGERLPASGMCRDTRELYERRRDGSYVGKIVWDTMVAVEVLASLPEVDASRIALAGHSLGGHSAIFAAALDARVRAVVASGSTSAWYEKHQPQHWSLDDSKGEINCNFRSLRPYLTPERWREIPVQWPEILSLLAPRPFLNIQAGRCPHDDPAAHWAHYEGLHAGVRDIYNMLDAGDRLLFLKTDQPHAFPAPARELMCAWLKQWLF